MDKNVRKENSQNTNQIINYESYDDDQDAVKNNQETISLAQTSKSASRCKYTESYDFDKTQSKRFKFHQKQFKSEEVISTRRSFTTQYSRELISKKPTRPHRGWQKTDFGKQFKHFNNCFKFKIVSYNLLAPDLLRDNFYLYNGIDKQYLNWNYRRNNLFQEIKRIHSHIYCFQEMQANDYEEYFKKRLSSLGLESVYKKRYGDEKPDGCCIAFRRSHFEIEKHLNVDYFIPGVDILNRENVGIVLLLKILPKNKETITEPKYICVATTHILYNPKRGDCKLAQLQVLLANMDRMAFKKSKITDNKQIAEYYPTILCGDFNCSNESKIYKFLIESKLEDYKNLNRVNLSGQKEELNSFFPIGCTLLPDRLGISDQSQFKQEVDSRYLKSILDKNNDQDLIAECTFGSNTLYHSFNFQSVYNHYDEDKIPEITSCIQDCHKSVDFIFYHSENEQNTQSKDLNLLARLQLYNENHCKDFNLPNMFFSSDHFMIAAEFILNK